MLFRLQSYQSQPFFSPLPEQLSHHFTGLWPCFWLSHCWRFRFPILAQIVEISQNPLLLPSSTISLMMGVENMRMNSVVSLLLQVRTTYVDRHLHYHIIDNKRGSLINLFYYYFFHLVVVYCYLLLLITSIIIIIIIIIYFFCLFSSPPPPLFIFF